MPITQTGTVKDKRGRTITIIKSDGGGKYPLLGIQYRKNKPTVITKGGVREYTASGKFYANGGRVSDPLDLDLSTFVPGRAATPAPEMVSMEYRDGRGRVLGGPTSVAVDSEEHEDLMANGWTEVEGDEE